MATLADRARPPRSAPRRRAPAARRAVPRPDRDRVRDAALRASRGGTPAPRTDRHRAALSRTDPPASRAAPERSWHLLRAAQHARNDAGHPLPVLRLALQLLAAGARQRI